MVISKLNYDDVEAFFRMVASLRATPEYAFINCNGNAVEEWNSKTISAQEKLKVLRLIDRLNQELGVEAFLPVCSSGCHCQGLTRSILWQLKSMEPSSHVSFCTITNMPWETFCRTQRRPLRMAPRGSRSSSSSESRQTTAVPAVCSTAAAKKGVWL